MASNCEPEEKFSPPNFNFEIPPVAHSGDIAAGAYYFHYSAADWGKKFSYTPMLGTYDTTEAGVMGQHRQWADAVGVDFFIFKWIKD